jgi:hypothetical protein
VLHVCHHSSHIKRLVLHNRHLQQQMQRFGMIVSPVQAISIAPSDPLLYLQQDMQNSGRLHTA